MIPPIPSDFEDLYLPLQQEIRSVPYTDEEFCPAFLILPANNGYFQWKLHSFVAFPGSNLPNVGG